MLSNPTFRKQFTWKKRQIKNHLWLKPKYSVSVEMQYILKKFRKLNLLWNSDRYPKIKNSPSWIT